MKTCTHWSRRTCAFFLLALVAFFVTGCGSDDSAKGTTTPSDTTTKSTATPSASGFKVALITPSPVTDKGWGASANDGIQKIKTELSAEAAPPSESPAPADVAGIFQNFAQDGNTIVFGHGSEYDDAAKQVAPKFPKTTFVVMNGRATAPNLIPIQFAAAQGTYLAGMVAGGMTKTNKIGLVGGDEIPVIKAAFEAFKKGVKAVNPKAEVKVTYTGTGTDPAKAKQQAQALLDGGCDVLMHNANAAGAGVFQAVSGKPGAMVIGANADQSDQATAQNIGSFILDVPSAMLGLAKEVKDGKTDGKPYMAGLKGKAVFFKFNPGFKGTIPADLKTKMEKAEKDMVAGTLDPSK